MAQIRNKQKEIDNSKSLNKLLQICNKCNTGRLELNINFDLNPFSDINNKK